MLSRYFFTNKRILSTYLTNYCNDMHTVCPTTTDTRALTRGVTFLLYIASYLPLEKKENYANYRRKNMNF